MKVEWEQERRENRGKTVRKKGLGAVGYGYQMGNCRRLIGWTGLFLSIHGQILPLEYLYAIRREENVLHNEYNHSSHAQKHTHLPSLSWRHKSVSPLVKYCQLTSKCSVRVSVVQYQDPAKVWHGPSRIIYSQYCMFRAYITRLRNLPVTLLSGNLKH